MRVGTLVFFLLCPLVFLYILCCIVCPFTPFLWGIYLLSTHEVEHDILFGQPLCLCQCLLTFIIAKFCNYKTLDKHFTIFELITTLAHISAQSRNLVVFRLQPLYFYLLLYKNICCWYSFELPQQETQTSTNNIMLL